MALCRIVDDNIVTHFIYQMEEEKLMTQEELEFRRRCPYDAFGDYSDVLKEIRQKEKENKTDTVSVVNRSK